jgi:hypothetical protein
LAEKKFSGCTVPNAAVGKAVADGFYVFADGFGHSAKELFPVVQSGLCTKRSREEPGRKETTNFFVPREPPFSLL